MSFRNIHFAILYFIVISQLDRVNSQCSTHLNSYFSASVFQSASGSVYCRLCKHKAVEAGLDRNVRLNCTHIIGNLVIDKINVTKEENFTDIFAHVQEISGSLILRQNRISSRLSFPRLHVIRGKSHSKSFKYSFIMQGNEFTPGGVVSLPKLATVVRGDVLVRENIGSCGFLNYVDWKSLLLDLQQQTVEISTGTSCLSSTEAKPNCAYFWGPDETQDCQEEHSKKPDGHQHCHSQCLAGCFGPGPSRCKACRHYNENGTCVANCKDAIFHTANFRYRLFHECTTECPAGMLVEKNSCVFECSPGEFYQDGHLCLPCQSENGLCNKSRCKPQLTAGRLSLDGSALQKLAGCVIVDGDLILDENSFRQPPAITRVDEFDVLKHVQTINGRVMLDFRAFPGPLTSLSFLRDLRRVQSGDSQDGGASQGLIFSKFSVMNAPHLQFLGLSALKFVPGSMLLFNNSKLCYVDTLPWWFSEDSRHNGASLLHNDTDLTSALSIQVLSSLDNGNVDEFCRSKQCDKSCETKFGCWGPGPEHCVKCRQIRASSRIGCVASCLEKRGFAEQPIKSKSEDGKLPHDVASGTHVVPDVTFDYPTPKADFHCLKCHSECDQSCTGPDAHECLGPCRNYREGQQCVSQCSPDHYPLAFDCLPCSNACKQSGERVCTGPEVSLGRGGCTACDQFIKRDQQIICIRGPCPDGWYLTRQSTPSELKRFLPESIKVVEICKPCQVPCSQCTIHSVKSKSLPGGGCSNCSAGVWHRGNCLKTCPSSETYKLDEQRSRDGHCLACHDECNSSCDGPESGDCHTCRHVKMIIFTKSTDFQCLNECPPSYPQRFKAPDGNVYCYADRLEAFLPDSAFRPRYNTTVGQDPPVPVNFTKASVNLLVILVLFSLLLIALIIVMLVLRARKTAQAKAKLFTKGDLGIFDGEEKERLLGGKPPNLSRLTMIHIDQLIVDQSRMLGKGAFGEVYQGIWMRPVISPAEHSAREKSSTGCSTQNSSLLTTTTTTSTTTNSSSEQEYEELDGDRRVRRLQVAVKILNEQSQLTDLQELLDEARVMASVDHKHCLPLLGVCLSGRQRCLVSQYLPSGSLDSYLETHREEISGGLLLDWCRQIADGMAYLQTLGILHRDLASRNVLVASMHHLMLTDFGLAKVLSPSEDQMVVRSGRAPIRWLAIETLKDAIYSFKTDVWAYGVTLWEIFTFGHRPYSELPTTKIAQYVIAGNRLPQPYICRLALYRVMLECWNEEPELRPTFDQLTLMFMQFAASPYSYVHPTSISPIDFEMVDTSQNGSTNNISGFLRGLGTRKPSHHHQQMVRAPPCVSLLETINSNSSRMSNPTLAEPSCTTYSNLQLLETTPGLLQVNPIYCPQEEESLTASSQYLENVSLLNEDVPSGPEDKQASYVWSLAQMPPTRNCYMPPNNPH